MALALGVRLSIPPIALAQSQTTANTMTMEEYAPMPAADLSQIAWLVGHWRGEVYGGVAEEWWTMTRRRASSVCGKRAVS